MAENTEKNLKKTSASPKARKFARELGVDINQVSGRIIILCFSLIFIVILNGHGIMTH